MNIHKVIGLSYTSSVILLRGILIQLTIVHEQRTLQSVWNFLIDFYLPAIVTMAVAASVLATEIPAACPSTDLINTTIHIAHESDPTMFYICVMGDKREMDCPEYKPGKKLCFNPEKQQCDWPDNVARCKKYRDSRCSSSENTTAVWAHPYNCRLYYTCKNSIMNLNRCDEGWLFDPKSGKCAPATGVVCNKPTECPPVGSYEIVLLPHECHCAKYYECCDGESILKNCDSGEMFDKDQRQCVPDEEAACSSGHVTVKPPTTTPPTTMCPPGNDTTEIPHETNCELYYTCENGRKQLKECDYRLYFDEIMGMCTWWEDVNCGSRASGTTLPDTDDTDDVSLTECPPKGSNEYRTLPHECSCVKYYLCANGLPILQLCKNGTEYDYIRRICDDPKNFKCIRPIPVPSSTTATAPTTTTTAAPTTTTTSAPIRTPRITTPTHTFGNITCPFEGDKKKIPHEYKCNAYYTCDRRELMEGFCLENHYFNPIIEECDLIGNPNCTHRETTSTSTIESITVPDPEKCNRTCLVRNPDPNDCAWYYECKDGDTQHKKCPEGLKFNPSTETCDLPDYVHCKDCTSSTDAVIYCKCPNTTGDKLPHECQCDRYYICKNGKAQLESCPPGYLYDRVKQNCDVASNVPCNKYSNTNSEGALGCNGTCLVRDPDPNDCAGYLECENGKTEHKKCREGLEFNPSTEMCDWPRNANCKNCTSTNDAVTYCKCPNTTGDKLPHECQCDRYYICVNGNAKVQPCPTGYLYDRVKHECDVAINVDCDKSPNNKSQNALGCIGTCPAYNSEYRPPVTYLPHKDCTIFCYCDNGTPLAYKCSKGLHFSKEEQRCTDPATAQCVSSFTYDDRDQESTNAKETSIWTSIPLIGRLFL